MTDSDMDIDDDDVEVQVHPKSLEAPGSQNDVKKHINEKSKEQTNSGKNVMLGDEKGPSLSRFPALGQSLFSVNGPEQKRAALPCNSFSQGRCANGTSCRFLHVKGNTNHASQQQVENHMAQTSEVRALWSKESGRFPLLGENGVTSLANPSGGQRAFPFTNEMRFMPSLESMGRGSLQKGGAVFRENRPVLVNSISYFPLRSSFVQEHGASATSCRQTDMGSTGPAWTGSLFTSVPMNQYASNLGNFEYRSDINGSESPPMVQAISVSSVQDAEGNTTINKKKVSSNDWEPSQPFRASFKIPPYILPSSDALYDPFTYLDIPQDKSLNASSSSKGRDAEKKTTQQKNSDSDSGPQDCNNDDKNSSCSQTPYQGTVARKNMEAVEGVATSVVDQNDAATPSKEVYSSEAAENRSLLKRSKPSEHGSWHRSDHKKLLKSDARDGEVRSDAGTKAMRQFRTAVVETIKEMVKPLWREGRLTKEVHNMVVKRASEKIVSAAVQSHQVPIDSASVDQYLSMSATKIMKLVEGYVEKYGKPKP